MPLQGHNTLGLIFMVAPHIGCGKLSLITHNKVSALCWLSARLGHSRASELQDHRLGYPRLLDYCASGRMVTASRQLLGMSEEKDMKQWAMHSLRSYCSSYPCWSYLVACYPLVVVCAVPYKCLAITFLISFAQAAISPVAYSRL